MFDLCPFPLFSIFGSASVLCSPHYYFLKEHKYTYYSCLFLEIHSFRLSRSRLSIGIQPHDVSCILDYGENVGHKRWPKNNSVSQPSFQTSYPACSPSGAFLQASFRFVTDLSVTCSLLCLFVYQGYCKSCTSRWNEANPVGNLGK